MYSQFMMHGQKYIKSCVEIQISLSSLIQDNRRH